MVDREESSKRLEMRVKSISSVTVAEEPNPSRDAATNMASPDVDHIGSMVGEEDAFPTGMRRRVIEPPLGSKIGYHELEDEKEDADEEWMTGEASHVSGGGTRGSNNWVLKVLFPILLIVGIICMHNWWTDVKYHVSNAAKAVSDVFDRRALLEEEEAEGRWQGRFSGEEGERFRHHCRTRRSTRWASERLVPPRTAKRSRPLPASLLDWNIILLWALAGVAVLRELTAKDK